MKRIPYCIIHFILGMVVLQLSSCSGCSKTGRERVLVRMALEESLKEVTDPDPNSLEIDTEPVAEEIDDIASDEEQRRILDELENERIGPAQGKLIQVEGLVAKEVFELLVDLGVGPNAPRIEQIHALKDYVIDHWRYVYDPEVSKDVWRSAEATLALKYRGYYTGDCDDFAILMASFARQIGLSSMVLGGFDSRGDGHAFAVYQWPNNSTPPAHLDTHVYENSRYVSLDWFSGQEHSRFQNLEVLLQ